VMSLPNLKVCIAAERAGRAWRIATDEPGAESANTPMNSTFISDDNFQSWDAQHLIPSESVRR
jgi:hypothetical protein